MGKVNRSRFFWNVFANFGQINLVEKILTAGDSKGWSRRWRESFSSTEKTWFWGHAGLNLANSPVMAWCNDGQATVK